MFDRQRDPAARPVQAAPARRRADWPRLVNPTYSHATWTRRLSLITCIDYIVRLPSLTGTAMGAPISVRLDDKVRSTLEVEAKAHGVGLGTFLRQLAEDAAVRLKRERIRA